MLTPHAPQAVLRRAAVPLAAAAALAACGGEAAGPAASRPQSAIVRGEEVRFPTDDGVRISGTVRTPPGASADRPAPAVVLVHQQNGDRSDFNLLLPHLRRAGFVTLVYDHRGRGRSRSMVDGTVFRPGTDRDRHVETLPRDVQAAIRHLAARGDVDRDRIAVVGASTGANVAWISTSLDPNPRAAVALSPIAGDVLVGRGREGFRPRRTLFIASRLEAAGAWELARRTRRPRAVALTAEGHGVPLLVERRVREQIVDWLLRFLSADRAAPRAQPR